MIEPKPIISWLVNLGDILGVAQSTFAKAETSQSFEYIDSKLPVERFLKIGIDVFEEGRRLFSDSLSITCRIGDMDVFSFSKTDWESQVRNLLATATNGQSMEFELEINKSRLLANSGIANNPGQEVTLFFWFDGFDGLFRESLCAKQRYFCVCD